MIGKTRTETGGDESWFSNAQQKTTKQFKMTKVSSIARNRGLTQRHVGNSLSESILKQTMVHRVWRQKIGTKQWPHRPLNWWRLVSGVALLHLLVFAIGEGWLRDLRSIVPHFLVHVWPKKGLCHVSPANSNIFGKWIHPSKIANPLVRAQQISPKNQWWGIFQWLETCLLLEPTPIGKNLCWSSRTVV